METAVFGGGCFWCLETIFGRLKGVSKVTSGYAGGQMANPTYEQVCSGRTGHAEVFHVEYDPAVIGYRDLLEVFFKAHDPTTLNRQGTDVGSQYRSIIFYADASQKAAAESVIAELGGVGGFKQPVVTEVKPLETFYPAEDYHQDYYRRHPENAYCQAVIGPKLARFFKT
jgi:peptide-methionine (S)-S-oxide reductase